MGRWVSSKLTKELIFCDGSSKLVGFLDRFKSISEVNLRHLVSNIRGRDILGDGHHPKPRKELNFSDGSFKLVVLFLFFKRPSKAFLGLNLSLVIYMGRDGCYITGMNRLY